MASCETWQASYSVSGYGASTAQAACTSYAHLMDSWYPEYAPITATVNGPNCANFSAAGDALPWYQAIDHNCDAATTDTSAGNTIKCDGACTVGIELKPAPAEPEHIADMSQLFTLFLVAAIVIFCAKGLLKLFESAPHGEN